MYFLSPYFLKTKVLTTYYILSFFIFAHMTYSLMMRQRLCDFFGDMNIYRGDKLRQVILAKKKKLR